MENRSQNTKAVVEAGMVSALVVLITLISMYLGLSGYIGVCILPIPITVVYIRQNFKISLITVLVSTILVGLFFNPIEAVANTLLLGLIGISLGYCLKRKFSSMKTYAIFGVVVAIGAFLYTLIYVQLVTGVGVYATVDNMIKQTVASTVSSTKMIMGSTPMNAQQKLFIENLKALNATALLKLMPGGLIVIGFMLAYINYKITNGILKRLKYKTEEMFPLTKIYIPNILGAVMISVVLIGYILTLQKLLIGDYILQSSLVVIAVAFAISGMSLTAYYLMNKYKVSKTIVVIILVAAFIFQLYQAFVILGLVDLVINFRKLDPNPIFKK
jgi:uncharacterized protein YybS (DUF2232 family)